MIFQSEGGMSPAVSSNTNGSIGIGSKRLASCREELEQSWRGVYYSGGSSGADNIAMPMSKNNLRCISYDGPLFVNNDNNEDESSMTMTNAMTMSGDDNDDDDNNCNRVKRRKTLTDHDVQEVDDDTMTMTTTSTAIDMECCTFVRSHRISSTYCRPPRRVVIVDDVDTTTTTQVKAGWYEGSIDAFGNRHGRGITRHDDGTEYEGPYVRDVMEGVGGKYKFITERRLVPDSTRLGSTSLHRQIEKTFEGIFDKDEPRGAGMLITKTIDCAPQVLGSSSLDIRFMEVVYDVGMFRGTTAIGEGVRIIFYSTTNVDGRSTLEKSCKRLMNGEDTNMKVANEYATWICHCLGMADIPVPSFSV